ncbi:MAG TPA: PsbP-related protein [Candidatus Saccharimonadales bacterium]|nr:PsbP-related protein [Candidatus Saccharimonadales bacterium]
MKQNEARNGFSVVELLIILLVLAILGAAGFFAWRKTQDKPIHTTHTTKTTNLPKKTSIALKTYTNDEYKFSFQYPETWKLTTDLEDTGRGQEEGKVFVTSPDGTRVHFDPNLGGKGGDCAGEDNTYTTRTCSTLDILSVEQISNESIEPIYFCRFSLTYATDDRDGTVYYVGIESGSAPEVGSALGNFLMPNNIVNTKTGTVTIHVEGKDDDKNNSLAFFDTIEAKEATPILKSFKLLQ